MNFEKELKDYYYKVIMPATHKAINEFKKEMGEEGRQMRLRYLRGQQLDIEEEIMDIYNLYQELCEQNRPYVEKALIVYDLPVLKKKIKKIKTTIRILSTQSGGDGITIDMILQAREYPITDLILSKRNMAICPFHDDKHPSMSIKNNYYYCFGCGVQGDVIDFVMKRDNSNFKSVVKLLGGGK